jgi:hypothetical protein
MPVVILAETAVTAVVLAVTQEELLPLETAVPEPVVRTLRTAAPQVVLAVTPVVRFLAQVEALLTEAHHLAVVLALVTL